MKKRDTPPPTEAEIRKHNNVPVELAARYITIPFACTGLEFLDKVEG